MCVYLYVCVHVCIYVCVYAHACVCVGHVTADTRVGTRSRPPPDLFDNISAEADRQSWAPQAKSFPFQAYSPHQAFVVCSPGVVT